VLYNLIERITLRKFLERSEKTENPMSNLNVLAYHKVLKLRDLMRLDRVEVLNILDEIT